MPEGTREVTSLEKDPEEDAPDPGLGRQETVPEKFLLPTTHLKPLHWGRSKPPTRLPAHLQAWGSLSLQERPALSWAFPAPPYLQLPLNPSHPTASPGSSQPRWREG